MFSEEYKKDNEKVSPSPELKSYIGKRLEHAEIEQVHENKKEYFKTTFWRGATAALSLVLLATTIFVGRSNFGQSFLITSSPETTTISKQSLSGVKYSEIYESFKKVEQQMQLSGQTTNGGKKSFTTFGAAPEAAEDTVSYEESYSEDDADNGVRTKGDVAAAGNSAEKPSTADAGASEDHSDTNTQVEGVDEADIVKTDGSYIYSLIQNKVVITSADKGKLGKVSEIKIETVNNGISKGAADGVPAIYYDYAYKYASDMYVSGDRLALIRVDNSYNAATKASQQLAMVYLYDITDKKAPKLLKKIGQSGSYISSRLTNGVLYLFSNQYFYSEAVKDQPQTYVPATYENDSMKVMPEKDICVFGGAIDKQYLISASYKLENGDQISAKSVLGGGNTIYANTDTVLVAAANYSNYYITVGDQKTAESSSSSTRLIRLSVANGEISGEAFGDVPGTLLNQFSMDEYDGHFRLVTTVDTYTNPAVNTSSASSAQSGSGSKSNSKVAIDDTGVAVDSSKASTEKSSTVASAIEPDIAVWGGGSTTTNALYVLDKELKTVGKIENLAKGERVYSVRFTGKYGYFVTFRQVDPLFCVDLSNPKEPTVLSALKIPGFSNYLHPYANGLLFGLGMNANENGRVSTMKLSMFDVSNPANVTEKNKISVDSYYSEASYNHKAILINQKRDLIGFAGDNSYFVYGYSDQNGFYQKAELPYQNGGYGNQIRGLFIGDYFYVCDTSSITSYAMSNWKAVDNLIMN